MRKLLLAVLVTATLGSCEKAESNNRQILAKDYDCGLYCVMEIDSCEYIAWHKGYAGGLVHKHNCKFCKQRNTNPINK